MDLASRLSLVASLSLLSHVSTTAQVGSAVCSSPQDCAVGDINGDGKEDLVVTCCDTSGEAKLLLNMTAGPGPTALGAPQPWFEIPACLEAVALCDRLQAWTRCLARSRRR